ncbi:MAG: hypothetical protein AAGF11_10795 [Myxococcota bacterium]
MPACQNVGGEDGGPDLSTASGLTEDSGSTDPTGTAQTSGPTNGTGADGTGADGTGADADSSGSGEGGSESSTSGDPPPPAEPCTAVDMIFVVDNSDPMLEEQLRLLGSTFAFVQQVQQTIPTLVDDIHIGVITTDDELFVQPGESGVPGCELPYEGGNPWMISSSVALQAELECALMVGAEGSPNERPMDMLTGALSDENLAPGGLHNGFLRDEALLVVVLVTNEDDEIEDDTAWGSMGEPADWVATVAGRKGGWVNDVVVLSLLGTPKPNACPKFQWDGTEGAQVAPRLIEYTESFPQGAVGDICLPEYATFMLGVVPGVTAACAAYTPI